MAATLVVAALLAWWLWPKNYEEMIPAQAKAVVRIQPAKLQKEVGNIPNPLRTSSFDDGCSLILSVSESATSGQFVQK